MNDSSPHHAGDRVTTGWINRRDQRTLAVIVGVALLALVGWRLTQAWYGTRWVDYEQLPQREAQFQVDLNRAGWPELELLPEVGETTARRIVAFRAEHGPFTSIEQLLDVQGIGPKTLDELRPYLLPLEADSIEAVSPPEQSTSD